MASSKKAANRAHALAAWEWFKEAAWLQVLLIVSVVVGLVVAIPFAVQGIVNAINDNTSTFFKSNRIAYSTLTDYLNGNDNSCDGLIGDDTYDSEGHFNTDVSKAKELGFVVIFYKSDCSDCDTMQSRIETWYSNFNSSYGNGKIKLYTIDCSWVVDNKSDTTKYSGQVDKWNNPYITLEDQQQVMNNIKDVYLDQDTKHSNASVTDATFNTQLIAGDNDSSTIFTPLFITYTRTKDGKYAANNPKKVIFNTIQGLSASSETDIAKQMLDIFNFRVIK